MARRPDNGRFFDSFFFMHTKLNKNLYKVNPVSYAAF